MEPHELQDLFASLILEAGQPEIASALVLPSVTTKVQFNDGAAVYASVCHTGKAADTPPRQPGWPAKALLNGTRTDGAATWSPSGNGAMRTSYFAGFARYLLDRAEHPAIAEIETFAEAGAVGFDWPPYGLKVSFRDGRAAYLSLAGTAAPGGAKPDLPAHFNPEDLDNEQMSGMRSADVGRGRPAHAGASAAR